MHGSGSVYQGDKAAGPQEGPAGPQEEAGAQKALESFQRAIIPDLSPCPPSLC